MDEDHMTDSHPGYSTPKEDTSRASSQSGDGAVGHRAADTEQTVAAHGDSDTSNGDSQARHRPVLVGHGSIVESADVAAGVLLARCADTECGCNSYHCPLCPVARMRPSRLPRMTNHLKYKHTEAGFTYGERVVLRCCLACPPTSSPAHYHCPLCGALVSTGNRFSQHVADCMLSQGLIKREDSQTTPSTADKPVNAVSQVGPSHRRTAVRQAAFKAVASGEAGADEDASLAGDHGPGGRGSASEGSRQSRTASEAPHETFRTGTLRLAGISVQSSRTSARISARASRPKKPNCPCCVGLRDHHSASADNHRAESDPPDAQINQSSRHKEVERRNGNTTTARIQSTALRNKSWQLPASECDNSPRVSNVSPKCTSEVNKCAARRSGSNALALKRGLRSQAKSGSSATSTETGASRRHRPDSQSSKGRIARASDVVEGATTGQSSRQPSRKGGQDQEAIDTSEGGLKMTAARYGDATPSARRKHQLVSETAESSGETQRSTKRSRRTLNTDDDPECKPESAQTADVDDAGSSAVDYDDIFVDVTSRVSSRVLDILPGPSRLLAEVVEKVSGVDCHGDEGGGEEQRLSLRGKWSQVERARNVFHTLCCTRPRSIGAVISLLHDIYGGLVDHPSPPRQVLQNAMDRDSDDSEAPSEASPHDPGQDAVPFSPTDVKEEEPDEDTFNDDGVAFREDEPECPTSAEGEEIGRAPIPAETARYKCPFCDKGDFSGGAKFLRHLLRKPSCGSERDPGAIGSEAQKYVEAVAAVSAKHCPKCRMEFATRFIAVRHYAHGTCESHERAPGHELLEVTKANFRRCTVCGYQHSLFCKAVRHVQRMHLPKTLPCLHCDAMFATQSLVERHVRETHNPRADLVICEVCGESVRSQYMSRHKRYVHDVDGKRRRRILMDDPIKCDLCSYQSPDPSNFRRHVQRIHSKKDVMCEFCGKATASRFALYQHQIYCNDGSGTYLKRSRPHITQKACPICGKLVLNKNLTSHISRSHKMEKRHTCTLCGSRYTTKYSLDSHLAQAHGQKELRPTKYQCSTCSKPFHNVSRYQEHLLRHSDKKAFRCPHCLAEFKMKASFRRHLVKFHGGATERDPSVPISERPQKGRKCTAGGGATVRAGTRQGVHSKEARPSVRILQGIPGIKVEEEDVDQGPSRPQLRMIRCGCGHVLNTGEDLQRHSCPFLQNLKDQYEVLVNSDTVVDSSKEDPAESCATTVELLTTTKAEVSAAASGLLEISLMSAEAIEEHIQEGIGLEEGVVPVSVAEAEHDEAAQADYMCGYCQAFYTSIEQVQDHILIDHEEQVLAQA